MTLEGLRLKLRKQYIRMTANIRCNSINKDKFTIISNNCWGGMIYESYGLQKQSPTVGMYFSPEDYLKLVSDLKHYLLDSTLSFIDPNNAKHKVLFKQDNTFGKYPIAVLDDIEIAMLHYHSQEEALEKWNRRIERICWDRLIVKFNDQNGCTIDQMNHFLQLPLSCNTKPFLTAKKAWANKTDGAIYIPQIKTNQVFASLEPFGKSIVCDVNKIINEIR